MKLRFAGVLVALVTFAPVAASKARAGYQLTQKGGQESLVSKGRIKQVPREADDHQSVLDLNTGRMWFSVPQKKLYWEGTVGEFCGQMHEMMSSMTSMMHKMMEEHMSKMPPEQRAKIEEMQKQFGERQQPSDDASAGQPTPKVAITRTEESATIAGQQTRKYRVTLDGELHEEAWLTTDPAIGKEFMLDKAATTMGRFSSCASERGEGARGARRTAEAEISEKLYPQGFPLKRVVYRDGKGDVEEEFTKVEPTNIPDSEFVPPPGYRRAATFAETMMRGMPAGKEHGRPAPEEEEESPDSD
jgi:hypothetical protein